MSKPSRANCYTLISDHDYQIMSRYCNTNVVPLKRDHIDLLLKVFL